MNDALNQLRAAAIDAMVGASDRAALKAVEQRYLGKRGELTAQLRSLGSLPPEQRPAFGKAVNELKVELAARFAERETEVRTAAVEYQLAAGGFDPTEPGQPVVTGVLHPITQITHELVDLFHGLGFTWLDGPDLELEYYNFDALNIPGDHPARENQDTFWLSDGNLLRTHTSPVQIRAMEKLGAPRKPGSRPGYPDGSAIRARAPRCRFSGPTW